MEHSVTAKLAHFASGVAAYLCDRMPGARSGERATSETKRISIAATAIWIAMLLAFCSTSQAGQSPPSLEFVLKQVDRQAKQFESLTADVERTKVTVVVNDRSTESGQMQVRHDAKMRIELTAPDPRTILRDGDHVFVYTPKTHQVEEYDLSKHRDLVDQLLLLGFGTSAESLKRSYLMTVEGEETLGGQKVVRLELTPKSEEVRRQISKIELWLDESDWLPAQQKFYETGTEDYFVIRYTNFVRNTFLPDSRFRPHWPAGVTRVKPQG
jgi:outer membrane lipoprotein-sorting protein